MASSKLKKDSVKKISVLEMSATEARAFFLKKESYCTIDLPNYFDFDSVLKVIAKNMNGKTHVELNIGSPSNDENVNYKLLGNKDGKFSWRPFEIVNPILYTSLVNCITSDKNWKFLRSKFVEFQSDLKIQCKSLPETDSKN